MAKRIVSPTRAIVLSQKPNWREEARQKIAGTVIFVNPVNEDGFPIGEWVGITVTPSGVTFVRLGLVGYQPLFALAKAAIEALESETAKSAIALKVMTIN